MAVEAGETVLTNGHTPVSKSDSTDAAPPPKPKSGIDVIIVSPHWQCVASIMWKVPAKASDSHAALHLSPERA